MSENLTWFSVDFCMKYQYFFQSEIPLWNSVEILSVSIFQPKITMISGQNITTFSCQKTNSALVVLADFNVRTCF